MKFFETSKYYSLKKSTYISLRWIGIIGQLISIYLVYFYLNFTFDFVYSNIIIDMVSITNEILVLKLRFDEEKPLGINIKITNGLVIPPDK